MKGHYCVAVNVFLMTSQSKILVIPLDLTESYHKFGILPSHTPKGYGSVIIPVMCLPMYGTLMFSLVLMILLAWSLICCYPASKIDPSNVQH